MIFLFSKRKKSESRKIQWKKWNLSRKLKYRTLSYGYDFAKSNRKSSAFKIKLMFLRRTLAIKNDKIKNLLSFLQIQLDRYYVYSLIDLYFKLRILSLEYYY